MSATVTLSLEVELGWGYHDNRNYEKLSHDRQSETNTLEMLLDVCDRLDIPFTFNVVSHLLHSFCDGSHAGPHSEEWFQEDPGTNVDSDPQFYAPDLISRIQDASVDHEFATHSYSHPELGKVSDAVVRWELDRVIEEHEKNGLGKPRSLVPPRHSNPSFDLVAEAGIDVVRTPFPEYEQPTGRRLEVLNWLITRSHPVAMPEQQKGLLKTYCTPHPSLSSPMLSNGQRPPHLAFKLVPTRVWRRIHREYVREAIERAINADSNLHLWSHLANISNDSQVSLVVSILRILHKYRDQGELTITVMGSLLGKYT